MFKDERVSVIKKEVFEDEGVIATEKCYGTKRSLKTKDLVQDKSVFKRRRIDV